jgi:nitroimidazol reductase NimA-like FMN-containing flavoprotein (pyridoxamine 5'-phosphate oxidase superfamily)
MSLINDLKEKQHAMEVLVRQLSATPEEKMAKVNPEKLVRTTMGKINIAYMSGKQHQRPNP